MLLSKLSSFCLCEHVKQRKQERDEKSARNHILKKVKLQ